MTKSLQPRIKQTVPDAEAFGQYCFTVTLDLKDGGREAVLSFAKGEAESGQEPLMTPLWRGN